MERWKSEVKFGAVACLLRLCLALASDVSVARAPLLVRRQVREA